jgi:hypothetical protein
MLGAYIVDCGHVTRRGIIEQVIVIRLVSYFDFDYPSLVIYIVLLLLYFILFSGGRVFVRATKASRKASRVRFFVLDFTPTQPISLNRTLVIEHSPYVSL